VLFANEHAFITRFAVNLKVPKTSPAPRSIAYTSTIEQKQVLRTRLDLSDRMSRLETSEPVSCRDNNL